MTDYPLPTASASGHVREEAVELAALSWLDLAGWRTVPGDYLAPDGPMGARTRYRDCILEPELRSALATLNPDADPRRAHEGRPDAHSSSIEAGSRHFAALGDVRP